MTNYSDLHDVAHELQMIADNNNTCPFCGGSLDVIEKNHEDCGFEVYRKCLSCGEEFV